MWSPTAACSRCALALILGACGPTARSDRDATRQPADTSPEDLTRNVNPMIGTGGHGHTFPGATVPFGMVQLSPDSRLTGWDGCSGYHVSDQVIHGFSHTHLSGTGISDYGDVLLMPTVGAVQLQGAPEGDSTRGYASTFDHAREHSAPGYYRVHLDEGGIEAELTATPRVGIHRYSFPETGPANIIVDLHHRDEVIESSLEIVGDAGIEGMRRSRGWARDQHVYFAAAFSRPFATHGVAIDERVQDAARRASGKDVRGFLSFEPGDPVMVKVGISAVDIEGARRNLAQEAPHWNFDRYRENARRAWNDALGKIEIEGGTPEQRTVFYTALYHSMLAPNLYEDVDGRYRGTDLKVHDSPDFENYTVFSLWDTYRATHPLFTIIEQRRTNDFIRTFLAQYEHGGRLPMWELAGNYTGTMIGYHAVPVIVDAYVKGIRDYDVEKAYEAMVHSADLDHLGLDAYRANGYIPSDAEHESVSKTLEYAYDDWCIARIAAALGKQEDHDRFIVRSQSYKNIFDPSTRFMRAKRDGSFVEPFDPAEVNFNYTEANAWQYSFYVPHDPDALIALHGGRENLEAKLDELFSTGSKMSGRQQADITGLIGQYAHGNEPSHHIAYLYNDVGRPWKTQKRVREILDTMYTDKPDGLAGNEDCGQMSAWYVLSALGLYPVAPGDPTYSIGAPLFPVATLHLENGNTFVIEANGVDDENKYVRSVELNGERLAAPRLPHAAIVGGGRLVFEMGPKPNLEWGKDAEPALRPLPPKSQIVPSPFVRSASRSFRDAIEVELASLSSAARIHYTIDGRDPTTKSPLYDAPLRITRTTEVRAVAALGSRLSKVVSATFRRRTDDRTVEIAHPYNPQYTAGGDVGLIDGIRGGRNFRTGEWQGYQGTDFEAVVDLGKVRRIRRVASGYLQDIRSWIWMPRRVEYAVSTDGKHFEVIATVENDVADDAHGVTVKDFGAAPRAVRARYVRVRATTYGTIPSWHPGRGGQAHIFVDEVVIE
jgi:predicted alpha-1,2-mannosidase